MRKVILQTIEGKNLLKSETLCRRELDQMMPEKHLIMI